MHSENGVIVKIYKSQVDPILLRGCLRPPQTKMGISSGPMKCLKAFFIAKVSPNSSSAGLSQLYSHTGAYKLLRDVYKLLRDENKLLCNYYKLLRKVYKLLRDDYKLLRNDYKLLHEGKVSFGKYST